MLGDGIRAAIEVSDDSTNGGLIGLLLGGTFLAFLGALLSARTGRQRHYDERLDKELTRLRGRNDELEDENDKLRAWMVRNGVDPDEVLQ